MKQVIKNPRITEKGSLLSGVNAYLFDVGSDATKEEVKKAVSAIYKVRPVKVNLLNVPKKRISNRGRIGVRKGGRKAVVYLKGGDKIEFV